MGSINFKRQVAGENEEVIQRVTEALKTQGFGVLTRIDLHQKFKEKLGKELPPVVILGACNPQLAFEAFQHNPDVASLLPCNAVIREIQPGLQSVELAKPSELLHFVESAGLGAMTKKADQGLQNALDQLTDRKIA